MKNKKSILVNAALLIGGIFLGWLFFGGSSSDDSHDHSHEGEVKKEAQIWTCSMHPQIKLPEKGDCPI